MSNLENEPVEVRLCDDVEASVRDAVPVVPTIEILTAREVPLGGVRALTVRRTLPSRARSMIGAWCFVDHYGPDDVSITGGMNVPPHPHTGLQTVSWLFAGEIEHKDSVGSRALVAPGSLNLMTAGRGISHSEVSTPNTTVLHGAQLWVALPDEARHREPFFEQTTPPIHRVAGAAVQVFMGTIGGFTAEATTFSRLLAAQVDLPAGSSITLAVNPGDEHGVLVDQGTLLIHGSLVQKDELAYIAPGLDAVTIIAMDSPARLLIIGGEPFAEQIVMWWNFVGRDHDEIVDYRSDWQHEAIGSARDEPAMPGEKRHRFPSVAGAQDHRYEGDPLPAPALPTVRLLPRRR